ncbi:MAG: sulfotransferase domain-containing protein [Propylenella sp.]
MSIVWLASYPKSGNTWMRAFLANYVLDAEEPADINSLRNASIASSRSLFDRFAGVRSSDLTQDEIDSLRPHVYRLVAAAYPSPYFVKVHDRYSFLPDGSPLFPEAATKCAIYIIRNPFDVAISGVAHFNLDEVEVAVAGMGVDAALCDRQDSMAGQLRQRLGTWSAHVQSWTSVEPFPVLVVRYEDMLLDPNETFANVVRAVGLPLGRDRLEKAIEFSSFERLRRQELESGFGERASRTTEFFRRGEIGDWVNHLSERQVRKVIHDHGATMRRFGYIDEQRSVVFGQRVQAM